jgi:uncharacterized protein (TIRG00374 family)
LTSSKRSNRLVVLILAVILIVGVGIIIAEGDQVLMALRQADWRSLPGAILSMLVAHATMGYAYALVCRMFAIPMSLRDLTEIGIVTGVLNRLFTAGGIAGFSTRYLLMNRHGVTLKEIIATSGTHFYLLSLIMITALPVGLTYFLTQAQVPPLATNLLLLMTVLAVVVAVAATLLLIKPGWRVPVLQAMGQVATWVTGKDLMPAMARFDDTMTLGIAAMRREPRWLAQTMTVAAIDWLASVLVLSFCLDAFGPRYGFSVALSGFVIGTVAGAIFLIPGGLGIQEGATASVLVLLGVPLGQAVLATLLFRAIFFFLPYLLTLPFYRRLVRSSGPRPEQTPAAREPVHRSQQSP